MDAAEIVMHEIDRERVAVVFHFLRERVRQAGEPTQSHADVEVLALNVARADVPHIGIADQRLTLRANARRRAIAAMSFDSACAFP